ncbi:hypothetical protein Y1Q_0010005 [Alligator mississippiensis]|uniref:Uncharacterized protein n=1 Tax=Alligator mississippiensis TaxID=8496 RepID=A0A151MLM9_ALLMI|nr:hypothetical protein Y1Q_0010005 [Alligator mississippiensis]
MMVSRWKTLLFASHRAWQPGLAVSQKGKAALPRLWGTVLGSPAGKKERGPSQPRQLCIHSEQHKANA